MRKEQEHFPAAQRLVAAYVVENYNQIPFLSITTLAKNIGVSDNTVVKFCNHLGYNKFAEFKKVFSDYAHSELVMTNKLSENTGRAADDDSFFTQELEEANLPLEETVSVPPARIKRMEYQSIKTESGIEMKIPTSLLRGDNDYVEFVNEPDGTISLLVKGVVL